MKKIAIIFLLFLINFAAFSQKKWVIAQNGKADFKTVQAALDAVPLPNESEITLFIKNGVYKEKLHLDSTKNHIKIIGEDKDKTILTFDDHPGKVDAFGKPINTQSSYSFLILGDDFEAENITFRNDAGFTAGQAVALEVHGDRAIFNNCNIIGNQDILFLNSPASRQFYKNCYIEGTTDFIFGAATAWFQNCHIHSKKNSHITAASTPQNHPYGFIFNKCEFTGDTGLNKVSLGRPWRPYASVIYMNCKLGSQIKPEGWSAWNQLETYRLARFAEYHNVGEGANIAQRVSWAKQLSAAEAQEITIKNVFKNWNPK